MNIVTGVGDNNGAGPLLRLASVNAPQMGEKRRRAILPTKRDTAEKKSGVDSLLKVDAGRDCGLTAGRDSGKIQNFGRSTIVVVPLRVFLGK